MRGKFKKDYWIIKFSGLFDPVYYLKQYPDVRRADIDPLEHFVIHGWKEGRKPNEWFNTREYLEKNPDVAKAGINPFVHWIRWGRFEGRSPEFHKFVDIGSDIKSKLFLILIDVSHLIEIVRKDPAVIRKFIFSLRNYGFYATLEKIYNKVYKSRDLSISNNLRQLPINIFVDNPQFNDIDLDTPVDILLPVYNAKKYVIKVCESIFRNTTIPYRLLICNDASTDKDIDTILTEFKKKYEFKGFNRGIVILRNDVNLGFVKTINKMYKYVRNHFIIINSDTEVPPKWLERLIKPIITNYNIATATPFTNACIIFSFPNMNVDNDLIEGLNVEEIDKFFQEVRPKYTQVPSAGGFCMAINKNVVDKLGLFDEIFGKGYGEENDFSMRAYKHGYKNVFVENLFVYHKHGASFPSEEKLRLMEKNLKILVSRYPEYPNLVDKWIAEDPVKDVRELTWFRIISKQRGSTCIIDHNLGGGANFYRNEILKGEAISILVTHDSQIIFFDNITGKQLTYLYNDFILTLEFVFKYFNLQKLIINNLVGFKNVMSIIDYLVNAKQRYPSLFYEFKVHDFYCICPIYVLVDDSLRYCEVPQDISKCLSCYSNNPLKEELIPTEINEKDFKVWRSKFLSLLSITDKIECFSNSSKEIILKAYPELKNKLIIKPHNVDYIKQIQNISYDKIRIGVLGNINTAKGGKILYELAQYISNKNIDDIELHFFGELMWKYDHPIIIKHGKYDRIDLTNLVKKNSINVILIPSILPETFSYTTEEAIKMGLFVAVFNLGAQGERVSKYEKGIILEQTDPAYILEKIRSTILFSKNLKKVENEF